MNSNQISVNPHSDMFYSEIVLSMSMDQHPIKDSHTNSILFSQILVHFNLFKNDASIPSKNPY